MAFVNQERKAKLAPAIKAALKKHGMKGTIAVRHHSALVVTLQSGPIDFRADYVGQRKNDVHDNFQVNEVWYKDHFTGAALALLEELIPAMNGRGTDDENFDNSDSMTDYFHVGWYITVDVGRWNKPYVFTGEQTGSQEEAQ